MAGTTYAAAKISGKAIPKQTIPANRVVPNALTGAQIKEGCWRRCRRLSRPIGSTALTADTAASATTAKAATTASTASLSESSNNAERLGGRPPSAYLSSKPKARIALKINVPVGSGVEMTASCLAGEVATGGGGAWYTAGTDVTVSAGTLATSAPLMDNAGTPNAWRAEGKNTAGNPLDFRAWVVCVPAG